MSKLAQFVVEFEDFARGLPRPSRLEGASMPHGGISCFIGILGFEPRCFAAAVALAGRHEADRVFCVHYSQEDMMRVNEKHRPKMDDALRAISGGKEPISLSHDDRALQCDFGDALIRQMSDSGCDVSRPETHVVFDITVGSSRLLLEGLHALLSSGVTLTLVYSEAFEYRPSFDEYQRYVEASQNANVPAPEFLTHGVEKVDLLRRMPGSVVDARPADLIAFPSFSPVRIGAVLEELSPSRVEWIIGVPHLVRNRWRIDAQVKYHDSLLERFHRHCYVSTFDYRETLMVLESIYRKRKNNYNIVVCSLGSKLQKVGEVLFHILRPEVGAVVSVPRVWDPERRSSAEPRAVYAVPLGPCEQLRERLLSTRTLRV